MFGEGFNVHAGPQIGILVSSKSDGEDLSKFYKSTDIGGAVGLGYELESGLNFNARYSMSLTTIGEKIELPLVGDFEADIKNSVISISVGYSF